MYTYKTFRKGGIHPEENKLSAGKPILDLPLPPLVTIPVLQHVGTPANTLVKKGDRVKTGQLIASGEGFISANIHASVSGTITRIEKLTDTSGYKRTAIEIETIQDEWVEDIDLSPTLIRDISLSPPEIILKIWNSGIVGLGGATFPTHVKVSLPKGKTPCCVVINGAECEPYLTSDHAIMLEKPEEILTGVAIMMKILDIERAIIGIEKNKQDAISLLSEKSNNFKGIQIQGLKVKYPQGSEKHLIKALTGREVPSAGLPIDIGVVVFNVATMFAVYEAVQKGKPLIDRIISVTGQTLKKPSNFRV